MRACEYALAVPIHADITFTRQSPVTAIHRICPATYCTVQYGSRPHPQYDTVSVLIGPSLDDKSQKGFPSSSLMGSFARQLERRYIKYEHPSAPPCIKHIKFSIA
jgi:hypothetical protein